MSGPQAQTNERNAKLELIDGTRLAGEIRLTSSGDLELSNTRVLLRAHSEVPTALSAGSNARLTLDDNVSGGTNGSSAVTIKVASNDSITMQLSDSGDDQARYILKQLSSSAFSLDTTHSREELAAIADDFKRRSLSKLGQLMKPFLGDLADFLFDLSTQVRHSSSDQNIFYDATIAIRRQKDSLTQNIENQLDELFAKPELLAQWNEDATSAESGALDLVDTAEFESSLAVDRMIMRGQDLYRVPLEALVIRFAVLHDLDPNESPLPVHIKPLSKIFQQTMTSRGYPPPVILKIFEFFTQSFIKQLDQYYQQLNQLFINNKVLPDLESEIVAQGSLLNANRPARPVIRSTPSTRERASSLQQDDANRQTADEDTSPTLAQIARSISGSTKNDVTSPAASVQRENYNNIYKSVIDALNFRRTAGDAAEVSDERYEALSKGGTWEGGNLDTGSEQQNLATARDIANALGSIQQDAAIRNAVEQGTSLREYLAQNKHTLGALKDTEGLTADSLNQLDLVDNLFGTIKSQLEVTQDLKPALGDLHIPLAKLALMDSDFFLNRTHPARAALDKLAKLSTPANFPNKALELRINEIVQEIVTQYEEDSSIFDRALEKIEKLVNQQERALSRNVERVVRIQEGQEKLHKAQQAVDRVVNTQIKTDHAPKVLVDLVENGLRDLMVLTHVKEGAESKSWEEQVGMLDQLKIWLDERDHSDANDEMITQRGLEAESMIDMIEQQIAAGLPTNVAHQPILRELRDIIAGERNVEFGDYTNTATTEPVEPAQVRAKIEDLPRLRRWVMRVEQMEKGTWLTYRNKEGQKSRMQLAWVSEERDRYIFVNERGQKVADISNIQLARHLSRGMQPPAPADQLSVVDQSLYQTLEHVQKTLSFTRNHDSLTKLINRVTFLDQMGRALRHAQKKRSQHSVLYLNIDQFRLVNEVYDRVHGDQVLLEFARLLAQLHSKKASSARIESDSFGVLLLDRNIEQSMQVAEKIRRDIEASSVDIEGEKISFTVSIGVVPIREHSPDVGQILNTARTTMHLAKEKGRNRVVQYEEDQSSASNYTHDKLQVKRDLEQAVATDRFVLQAQPIVKTSIDGKVVDQMHFELLLGLKNKDGTLASPQDFILSAERYGFMSLVDRWVVKEAFSWVSKLMDAQKVVPSLSINLSGTSVTDDSFMDYLFEQISEYGVGTSKICFEITETGTISNLVKAADFVRAFRNIGCKFSIDDFGTGLASHNYLRELPVDYVKIDGSFVTNIHKNRNDYAIARSINDLAHFLGQETIAESVENDAIVGKLREIGVDFLQGWGVGRPKRLVEVAEDLSSIEK
ncbi:MAG: DUF1631 family protein [Pseudomonadota bacterium]